MTLSRRSAFTFVELCIAVSIISILAAILFPVFGRAREKARQAMCQSNLEQIGLALRLYAQDHSGQFPPTDNDLESLYPRYLPDQGVLLCPTLSLDRPQAAQARYVYRGGFAVDDDPTTELAADPDAVAHNGGCNVLSGDGHVKWYNTNNWDYGPFRGLAAARGATLPPPPVPTPLGARGRSGRGEE
jgi:prepilin-type N-terminal cleavage/methylation domain-containing protein/prepilin-type processing-associated H-X9-DG protein